MASAMIIDFPSLPLLCLSTAQETNTSNVVKGKNVVIDFWTTRCTRCPAALDRLNEQAVRFAENVAFVSICCDKLDGAREIIEKDDELRWQNLHHYFMEQNDKERAKKIFGFKAVPFYVAVNDKGEIEQMGNSIDWDNLPGCAAADDKENETVDNVDEQSGGKGTVVEAEREFVLEDLDF